jgi:hypothetical protein
MCSLEEESSNFETSCAYSVVYVFLRRWKKSFYLLVTLFCDSSSSICIGIILHTSSFTEVSIQTITIVVSKSVINYKLLRST